jgi:putative transposase
MKEMGISAVYPKPRTSIPNILHKKYPYLMGTADITGPNQAWCTDITYVRLEGGFAYLVAIMDWYSRRVLSWRLSNTMDTSFCIDALREALEQEKPEIFNSDQGSQFTSNEFTSELLNRGITISMDGRGRVYDNIFIERLWRSVKYENIYPKGYRTIAEARTGLTEYFREYNRERPHQSLSYLTPDEVHYAMAA